MYDCTKSKAEQKSPLSECSDSIVLSEAQTAGNAAAIESMSGAVETEETSFLAAYDLEAPSQLDGLVAGDTSEGIDLDTLFTEEPELAASSDGWSAGVNGDGVAVELGPATQKQADPLLGGASQSARATGSIAPDGTASGGFKYVATEAGGDVAFGFTANLDSNGHATAGVQGRVADMGAAVQGDVDFAEDGSIESIGGGAEVEISGGKVSMGANLRPERVERNGTTVSWSSGGSFTSEAEYAGFGGGQTSRLGRSESVTFATEAEAKSFEARVQAGKAPTDTTKVDGAELAAMPAGTKLTREVQADVKGKAGAIVGGKAEHELATRTEIERIGASEVVVRTSRARSHEAAVSIDNGVVGASTGGGTVHDMSLEYRMDLSKPADLEAFETFQRTGVMPATVAVQDGEDMHGTTRSTTVHLPGVDLEQESAATRGQVIHDGERFDAVRGQESEKGSQMSRYDVPIFIGNALEGTSTLLGGQYSPNGQWLAEQGQRYKRWGSHYKAQQLLESGSLDGEATNRMTVEAPTGATPEERDAQARIRQVQRFSYEDQAQIAAVLHDQVTKNVDAADVDPAKLPAHGPSKRLYELETVIDADGTKQAREALRGDRGLPFEWGGMNGLKGTRDTLQGQDDTLGAFADAIAELACNGGDDALEGVREMAGADHMERWLKIEGDDTFIGRSGHADLARKLEKYSPDERLDVLAAQQDRLERLRDRRLYPEVPEALRDEEIRRTETLIRNQRGA
ncbi:MAG: hypothetical protein R3F61_09665 [Myxococcota bacterium]